MSIKQFINVNLLGNTKRIINLTAELEELPPLAEELEIIRVNSLFFSGAITRAKNDFILDGVIEAHIVQACSLTLDEIDSHFKIEVHRIYKRALGKKQNKIEKEIILSIDDEDIEVLQNDSLSLYDTIKEELLLEINPFIRKED